MDYCFLYFLARKLADTPANLLTPTIFAEQAQELLTPLGIDVKVYDQKWAEDQKMYSFLSVAKGSVEPPKFLEITYNKKGTHTIIFLLFLFYNNYKIVITNALQQKSEINPNSSKVTNFVSYITHLR